MNGKQCKKIRKIADLKAISWKEVITQGARAWRNIDNQLYNYPRTINVKDGVFFQRKLHPLSVGALVKKMKKLFKATSKTERSEAFNAFRLMIDSHPELLGIPAK